MGLTIPKFIEDLIVPAKEYLCDRFDGAFHFCEEPVPEVYDCNELAGDPQARDLCYLLQEKGLKLRDIDTGLSGKIFKPSSQLASPNGKIEAQEVYSKAVETIEEEYFSAGNIYSESATGLFIHKAWQAGLSLPWLLYDGDPASNDEMYAAHKLLKDRIDELVSANESGSELELANAIFEMAFSAAGLDLKVFDHLPQELDAGKTLLTHWGDCSEMSRMLYLMYRYAGLSARFVWVQQDTFGDPLLHMAVAVEVDGKEVIADSSYGFDAKQMSTIDVPLLTSLAIYTDNVADQDVNDYVAIAKLKRSLLYDPTFPLTYLYLTLGRYEDELGSLRSMFLERAYELDDSSGTYLDLIGQSPRPQLSR